MGDPRKPINDDDLAKDGWSPNKPDRQRVQVPGEPKEKKRDEPIPTRGTGPRGDPNKQGRK